MMNRHRFSRQVRRGAVGCAAVLALMLAAGVLSGCSQAKPNQFDSNYIRAAFPSIPDFQDLPTLMALDLLEQQGYVVVPTFYSQAELAVEALARGEADIGFGSTRTYWAGVQEGAAIKTIMEQTGNSWSVAGLVEIQQCSDFDGRRMGVHSEGSVSMAMLTAYIDENCPEIDPQILIIPGSQNRAAALLANELEATPLELADVVQLLDQDPVRFHVVVDFADRLPELVATGVHVSTEYAANQPQAIHDLVRAILTVHRQIAESPEILASKADEILELPEDSFTPVLQAHQRVNAWDLNGGFSRQAIEYSLGFYIDAGSLEPSLTVDDVAELSYLNAVLSDLGSVAP